MALERTVLDENIIKNILQSYFGIDITDIEKTSLGTANCYIVSDETKKYFLKEFQSDFDRKDLIQESKLVNYLAEQGIPVAKFIKTLSGELFVDYNMHLICLEEFISGYTYGYNDFLQDLLPEVAKLLADIHNTLDDYELPIDMGWEWVESFSIKKEQKKYLELIDILEQNSSDKYYKRIKEDLIYKMQLLSKISKYIDCFKDITYKSTHGDYQGCQLICENGKIKAVVDFSSARKLPAVWEIMRSYVQTSTYSRKNAKIDVDGLCSYVEEYMKYSKLTINDLEAMPYVYLFQLARSKYGYPQYLTTDSEDREGLLKFAFWRTDMCREVESKAKNIVFKLKTVKEKCQLCR